MILAGGVLSSEVQGLTIGGGGGIGGGVPAATAPAFNTSPIVDPGPTSDLSLDVAGGGGDGMVVRFETEDSDSFVEALIEVMNGAIKRGSIKI